MTPIDDAVNWNDIAAQNGGLLSGAALKRQVIETTGK
jgi:hypothetical protein